MKKISFKKLPRDVQNTIIRLQRPDTDRFVFFNRLSLLYWIPVGVFIFWLLYLLSATQYYLWEEWMFWILTSVTVVLALAAGYSLEKIIASKFAKLKKGYMFTPEECLKVSGGCVESWNLKEIDALRFHEDLGEIEVWAGEHEERIKTSQKLDAIKLNEAFDDWKAVAGEGVLANYRKPEYSYSAAPGFTAMAIGAAVCVLLAGAISFGAKRMNVNFDDRETWKRVDSMGTVEEYESYKLRHPNGKYAGEADRKIGDILVKLKDVYKDRAKKSGDPNAIAALAGVLEEAARRPDRTIFVKLNETLALDPALVKQMESKMGVTFDPYDYSIPRNGTEYRKNKMLGDIRHTFLSVTGNNAIRFEPADEAPAGAPVIEVNLSIKSDQKEMPYFRYAHFDGNHQSITYYAGAKFDFDFIMKGSGAAFYQTGYTAIPKDLNTGLVDRRDMANYSFDKVYFSSVSEGFGKFIEQVYGISE
jgi:hypothetical protein